MTGIYELTVNYGEDIREKISEYVLKNGWSDVYIMGAIGSVMDCAFNTPIDKSIPMNLSVTDFPGASEILSFTGEVMLKEKMDPNIRQVYRDTGSPLFVHIHASSAQPNGKICGGGLVKGQGFRALRVFLMPLDGTEKL